MKKALLLLIVGTLTFSAAAVEGMFLPFTLKQIYKDMKAKGLDMSYKKIYNEKKPSVSDAIVSLGGFCTAEIISPKGLLLTNHHCGYDAIREQSTPDNDLLTNGFWAKSLNEERPIKGLTASIVVKVEDVSERIDKKLKQINEHEIVISRLTKEMHVVSQKLDKLNQNERVRNLEIDHRDSKLAMKNFEAKMNEVIKMVNSDHEKVISNMASQKYYQEGDVEEIKVAKVKARKETKPAKPKKKDNDKPGV
ncbi:MAG: S46 family peptidase, partial [Putridiphycobacter sp.]|nr:S46 family peptidase [Putridiphycobacter sp.]